MAEQADAHDSKSCGVTRVGSTPTFGTKPAFWIPGVHHFCVVPLIHSFPVTLQDYSRLTDFRETAPAYEMWWATVQHPEKNVDKLDRMIVLSDLYRQWKFTMDRVNRSYLIKLFPDLSSRFSSLFSRQHFSTTIVLLILWASILLLAACGPASGANNDEQISEQTVRIAQEYQLDQDLAKARAALDSLDVANPRQWLMLQTELMIGENDDPALTASMIKLTEALNIQSNVIRTYAEQQGLAEPTPTFVLEAVAVASTPALQSPVVEAVADENSTSAGKANQAAGDAFSTVDTIVGTTNITTNITNPVSLLSIATPTAPTIPQARANDLVNVRSGPGTGFAVVAALNQNDIVDILSKTPAGDWWQVRTSNGEGGWVFAQLVAPTGDVGAVAVASDIPTPPATATPAPVAAAEPAPTAQPPAVVEAPAPEAPAPVAEGPDFRLVEKRLWDVYENGGYKDGPTVTCGEKRELHVYVRDANGSPLNGVAVQALLGAREVLVTGAQGKGDGKVEFVLGGGQDVTIARDTDGREVTADIAYGLTTDSSNISFDQLIAGQYCSDDAACEFWAKPTTQAPPCWGHFSWTVVFQRKY